MPFSILDTHAHLDMPQFDSDREAVIQRAIAAGVSHIITAGIDLESSQHAIELAGRHSAVLATVGFHPQEARRMKNDDINKLAELAKSPRVVAIGEIGLDYYREKATREVQLQVLKQQLALAVIIDLPVVIHSRQAERDMPNVLKDWMLSFKTSRTRVGVIHCYSGNVITAHKYLDIGFYISFGAYIGYPSSHLSEVIKVIPSDRLLIETDCPFLPPQSHRGKRNEPAYLPMTLAALARIRGESVEKLAQQTTENAWRLFKRP